MACSLLLFKADFSQLLCGPRPRGLLRSRMHWALLWIIYFVSINRMTHAWSCTVECTIQDLKTSLYHQCTVMNAWNKIINTKIKQSGKNFAKTEDAAYNVTAIWGYLTTYFSEQPITNTQRTTSISKTGLVLKCSTGICENKLEILAACANICHTPALLLLGTVLQCPTRRQNTNSERCVCQSLVYLARTVRFSAAHRITEAPTFPMQSSNKSNKSNIQLYWSQLCTHSLTFTAF